MGHARLQSLASGLFGVQWIFVGCAVWLVLDTAFLRPDLLKPNLAVGAQIVPERRSPEAKVTLSQMEGIWTRDLRQVLIEPKPKAKARPKPPPPPPPVRLPKLLATFVERGEAWALFVDKNGKQRVSAASEVIDDYRIARVRPGAATLTHGTKSYTLEVDKLKGAQSRVGRNRFRK